MDKYLRIGEKLSEISVCGKDISEYGIIFHSSANRLLPAIAPEHIEKSAAVLQNYIYKISGITVPIFYDCYPLKPDCEILLGGTNREYDKTAGVKYGDDDYDLSVKDGLVVINGGKRGLLYGVYAFIEKLGVRFLTKDVEKILYKEKIEINDCVDIQRPVFEYRDICDWSAFDADFSVKSRINGSFVRRLRKEDGGGVGFAGGFKGLVHTFSHLVPASVYYTEKPYLYALDKGVRNPGGLCMSEKETLDVVVDSAIKWLDDEESPTLVSISVNDGEMAYCHCEKCEEKRKKGWNDTDILFDFINKAQRRIKEKYPDVSVETISYQGVAETPNVVYPDEDIVIRVCSTGARTVAFKDADELYEKNKTPELKSSYEFTERLKKYLEITKKIYVWDYPYNYNQINAAFPVFGVLLKNARYFADNNVKGVFINGTAVSCNFSELKVYLLGKVLFDPYMSEERYISFAEEFLQGYYGAGWQYVKEYISLCEKLSNAALSEIAEPMEIIPEKNSSTYISKGKELLEKAYLLAENKGEKQNIKKLILQVEYYDVYCFFDKVMESGTEEQKKDYISRNEKLYNDLRKAGITRVLENAFLPVVKNFRQSIKECSYWDGKCVTGDRNNENHEREIYVIIPVDGEKGERADISFLYRTNNENENGNLGVWNGKEIADLSINPEWREFKNFKTIDVNGGVITSADDFSAKTKIPLTDLRLNLIPRHITGIIIRVKSMNAGAYMFVREPKKKQ